MYGQIHNEQHRSSQSSHNAAHSSHYCTNAIRKYHTDSSTVVLFVTVHYLAFVQVVLYMYMSQLILQCKQCHKAILLNSNCIPFEPSLSENVPG